MAAQHNLLTDPDIQAAIVEIRGLISARFPDATFTVGLGDDPTGVYLRPVVDVDDRGDVFDVFIDRLTDIQDVTGLPLYVVPARPPGRNAAILQSHRRAAATASA